MAKVYYVEGTITEIGFQAPSLQDVLCWLKLKPSADFIRKDGDLEKVVMVSENESILRLLKKFEVARFPIDSGIVPMLMVAKANHLTIRMSFGEIGADTFVDENQKPTVMELVVK